MATSKFAVKFAPEIVKVCEEDAEPEHLKKGDSVPVIWIDGG